MLSYIGEEISIIEHSLQAAYFISKKTTDIVVILASLLHDVGHILGLEIQRDMVIYIYVCYWNHIVYRCSRIYEFI